MISLTIGTKVPRRASSTNSSNDVCFRSSPSVATRSSYRILRCRATVDQDLMVPTPDHLRHRSRTEQVCGRALPGPQLELAFRLGDEHLDAADRQAALIARAHEERRVGRGIDQVE